jgi:hypothetical protein
LRTLPVAPELKPVTLDRRPVPDRRAIAFELELLYEFTSLANGVICGDITSIYRIGLVLSVAGKTAYTDVVYPEPCTPATPATLGTCPARPRMSNS